MIGQIGPLVEAGKVPRKAVFLHVVGGIIGGAATGLVVGTVGLVTTALLPVTLTAFLLVTALIVFGLADLGVLRLPNLGLARQTPGYWTCTLGPRPALLAWGLDLGSAWSTRLPNRSVAGLLLAAFLLHNPAIGASLLGLYGLGRTSAVAMAILRSPQAAADTCTLLSRKYVTFDLVGGAACLFMAGAGVFGAGWIR
jgi:hypothetical protein